jgi:hypothetical protein
VCLSVGTSEDARHDDLGALGRRDVMVGMEDRHTENATEKCHEDSAFRHASHHVLPRQSVGF